MSQFFKSYHEDGFCLMRSVFEKDFCRQLIDCLSTIQPKVTLPFTNIPWGYGNLLDHALFKGVSDNKLITKFCEQQFGSYQFNHLFVHNKSPWIGSSIEWHQEVFNIDTFAPGYHREEWPEFVQIYVALEPQDLDNGCIRIFPGSHKEGLLAWEDTVNEGLSHKRRLPFDILETLSRKYDVKTCELETGDVIFFNHLLVHGSGSNHSSRSRKAVVLQARKSLRDKDMHVFNKEVLYRTNFVIESLQKRIDELKRGHIYSDMNKENLNEIK